MSSESNRLSAFKVRNAQPPKLFNISTVDWRPRTQAMQAYVSHSTHMFPAKSNNEMRRTNVKKKKREEHINMKEYFVSGCTHISCYIITINNVNIKVKHPRTVTKAMSTMKWKRKKNPVCSWLLPLHLVHINVFIMKLKMKQKHKIKKTKKWNEKKRRGKKGKKK